MDTARYLKRIHYDDLPATDNATLAAIHRHHVFHVPFENIDIHYRKKFTLARNEVYEKVVTNRRGGFCYELNYLLHELLTSLGFSCTLISCRIVDASNTPGPPFDHMAILIRTDRQWIADVGFGDLFVTPLELIPGKVQHDGRSFFRIDLFPNNEYVLSMSEDGSEFFVKYHFDLETRKPEDFASLCLDKQMNPDSYFVRNTICTLPLEQGRITIFNNKLTTRTGNVRIEEEITGDKHLRQLLAEKFQIAPNV